MFAEGEILMILEFAANTPTLMSVEKFWNIRANVELNYGELNKPVLKLWQTSQISIMTKRWI